MRTMCRPALLLTLALVMLAGCASSGGPSVSGFPLLGSRVVSVGDDVVIRLPTTAAGGSKWRVTSFDSVMLRRAHRPVLERGSNGRPEWVVRFVARTPGETEIVFTRQALSADGRGSIGERTRFTVRIRG
jgi:hypothetical protein